MHTLDASFYPTRTDVWKAFPNAYKVRIASTLGKKVLGWYVLETPEEHAEYRRLDAAARVERWERNQLEAEETICLCGAPMVDGWCSVEGCACSATHTAIGDDEPAHAVMTRELFDLIVGGDE